MFYDLVKANGVAKTADVAGVSRSHLTDAIRGRRPATVRYWLRVGEALGIGAADVRALLAPGAARSGGRGTGLNAERWARTSAVRTPAAPKSPLLALVEERTTVSELARLLDVSRSHLSEMLHGRRSAPVWLLMSLAGELDLDMGEAAELLGLHATTPLDSKVRLPQPEGEP
jgi:plasmid maintenance system antidote protein VapI